jgi:hypothetical protein
MVSSRGRPIGVTDLGFMRIEGLSRSGWFHPNEEGDRLMPTIATPLPSMRAYFLRHARDECGNAILRPRLPQAELFADLAEALHHASALELAIHREDGSLVRTTDVGIQDTRWGRILTEADAEVVFADDLDAEAADLDDELHDEGWEAMEDDFEVLTADELAEEEFETWLSEIAIAELPRYQIHVMLLDESEAP